MLGDSQPSASSAMFGVGMFSNLYTEKFTNFWLLPQMQLENGLS